MADLPPDNSYDDVPYESHPFAQSHPSRLFSIGTLFGMRPTPVQKCRVLELGCAAGGNLIPMADYLPESQFVGIDNAALQIRDGLDTIRQLGLENITLKHASILDVDAAYGQFDYIICHGVFSWVPESVRLKILEICGTLLTPNGIAYVSYNTYPGWHMRGMIRDMMRFHAARFQAPKDRIQQARALLKFLTQSVNRTNPRLPELLNSVGQNLDALASGRMNPTQIPIRVNQTAEAVAEFTNFFPVDGLQRQMQSLQAAASAEPSDAAAIQFAAAATRGKLNDFAEVIRAEGAYPQLLKQEADSIQNQADHYLYHEHLEEVNEPVYFHRFIELAKNRGLKYLGEARVGTMVTGNFGADIEKTLKMLASDQIQAEQYMDFLRNRMFRETLLCAERHPVSWSVAPDSLRALHVASSAKPVMPEGKSEINVLTDESVTYRSPVGMTMATTRPLLKVAMHLLQTAYPASIPFDLLRKQARELVGGDDQNSPRVTAEDSQLVAVGLLNCYMSSDLIELYGMPITFARSAGAYPMALALARIHAAKTGIIANRRHEVVKLNELDRQLIPLLDGSNDRAALVTKLTEASLAGAITVRQHDAPLTDPVQIRAALETILDAALGNVARMGILVG